LDGLRAGSGALHCGQAANPSAILLPQKTQNINASSFRQPENGNAAPSKRRGAAEAMVETVMLA
jgi:hypothetical protein